MKERQYVSEKILAINNHHVFDIYQFNIVCKSKMYDIARSQHIYRYNVVNMFWHSLYANAFFIQMTFLYSGALCSKLFIILYSRLNIDMFYDKNLI